MRGEHDKDSNTLILNTIYGDFTICNNVLISYSGSSKRILIPRIVKSIASEICFNDCETLCFETFINDFSYSVFSKSYNLKLILIPDKIDNCMLDTSEFSNNGITVKKYKCIKQNFPLDEEDEEEFDESEKEKMLEANNIYFSLNKERGFKKLAFSYEWPYLWNEEDEEWE